MVRRVLLLAVVGLVISTEAIADDATPARWLCVSPRKGPFNECTKGNSWSEDQVERCREQQAKRRKRPSRLRVDDTWVEFPTKTWRCVALPADHAPRIAVENYGRTFAAWTQRATEPCASGVLDLVGPNFYGAMYATCSRRDHARDERLP